MSYNVGQQVYCKESNRQATVVSINEETVTIQYKVSGELLKLIKDRLHNCFWDKTIFKQTFIQD